MGQGRNFVEGTVTADTDWAELVAFDKNRDALTIFNTGAVTALIGFTEANAISLIAGASISFDPAPINAVGCKTSSGTTTLVAWYA